MKEVWFISKSESSYDNLMLWAASTTVFFGFCHSGKITTPSENNYDPSIHLSYGDIATDNPKFPSMLSIKLKYSNTNQERKGIKIVIGKTRDDLCPLSYAELPESQRIYPGLSSVGIQEHLYQNRFVESDRSALTKPSCLHADSFAGHNYHIGAATTAASAGICDSSIQSLGH